MNVLRNAAILLGTAALLVLTASLFTSNIEAQGPPTASVNVVNTPLEVAGAVGVSGDVNVVNNPNVHVASLPNTINTPANPVYVRDVGNVQPFSLVTSAALNSGEVSADVDVLTVADGKRAVIEFASFYGWAPTGQEFAYVDIQTLTTFAVLVPTRASSLPTTDNFNASQMVRLYLSEGETLRFTFQRSIATTTSGTAGGTINVSGYLVDAAP